MDAEEEEEDGVDQWPWGASAGIQQGMAAAAASRAETRAAGVMGDPLNTVEPSAPRQGAPTKAADGDAELRVSLSPPLVEGVGVSLFVLLKEELLLGPPLAAVVDLLLPLLLLGEAGGAHTVADVASNAAPDATAASTASTWAMPASRAAGSIWGAALKR